MYHYFRSLLFQLDGWKIYTWQMCCLTKHPFLVGVPMEFQVKGPQQSPGRGFIEKFPSLKGTARTWKWMFGIQSFPFRTRPIFRGFRCYFQGGVAVSKIFGTICFHSSRLWGVLQWYYHINRHLVVLFQGDPICCDNSQQFLFSGLAVVNTLIIRWCFVHLDRFLGWCFLSRIRVTMVMTSHH